MPHSKEIRADYVAALRADYEHARESYYNKDAELARAEGYIDILKAKLGMIRHAIRRAYRVKCEDKDHSISLAWSTIREIEKVLRSRSSAASRQARSKP